MSQKLNQQLSREQQIAALEKDWAQNPRWKGVKRGYSAADVVRLRGSLQPENTLAQRGAEVLWDKINGSSKKGYVNAFGAISAGQAMQQAKAGLEAVYLVKVHRHLATEHIVQRVHRSGTRVDLTAKEFGLLELLMRRSGEVLPRSLIASLVWDMNFDSDSNVIEVAVRRLRAKVDDPFEPKLIRTVRGMGYVLEAPQDTPRP